MQELKQNYKIIESILEKFSMDIKLSHLLESILDNYFSNFCDFNFTIEDLMLYLKLDRQKSTEILLYSGALMSYSLEDKKFDELKKIAKENDFDFEKLTESSISDLINTQVDNFIDYCLFDENIDLSLKILQFHLLLSIEESNSIELSKIDTMMMTQLMFDGDMKDEILKALSLNESIIQNKKISDWIKDLDSVIKEDYQTSLISKSEFINNQDLIVKDRNLLSRVFEMYLRIKFAPKSFDTIQETDYFIIPHIKLLSGQIEITNEAIVKMLENNLYDLIGFKELGADHIILNAFLSSKIDDDIFRRNIEDTIYKNSEQITDKNIKLESGDVSATASNWIKDYIEKNTIEKFDDIAFSSYILDSENTRNLSEDERKIVKRLLQFYLNIKFYLQIFTGVEREKWAIFPIEIQEETKKRKVFVPESVKEQIQKIPEKKVSGMDVLLNAYKNFELAFKNLETQVIKDLKLKKSTDLDEEFLNFINTNKGREAMVVLSYVCGNNLINIFFKDNKILQQEFKKFLDARLSEDLVNNVMATFGTATSISLFLQFLLIEKVRLIPKDVGLFGMYLANVFKKSKQEKYFPIVYGDVNSGMFVFRDIKDVAGKLQMK